MAIYGHAIMAIMAIMTIKAVPPYGYMAINMAKLGVYLKVWKNVDHLSYRTHNIYKDNRYISIYYVYISQFPNINMGRRLQDGNYPKQAGAELGLAQYKIG